MSKPSFSVWVLSNNFGLKWTGRLLSSVPKAGAVGKLRWAIIKARRGRQHWAQSARYGF